jgi:hypothetical protein
MEICFEPFSLAEGLRKSAQEPPATLLVLPNGWVKVAAALPEVCADLRRCGLDDAWRAYQRAWREPSVEQSVRDALADESRHRLANSWQPMNLVSA